MKVVICGAKGQVGTDLVIESELRGYETYGFSSSELDITDQAVLESKITDIKPDAVINAAAYTAVDKAENNKDRAYAINELGVKNLALICKILNIPLLHISTDYVFDGNNHDAYVETDLPVPTGVYGASKLAGELTLQQTWRKHIILRVSWVFGQYGNNFVKTMLRLANGRDELSVVNDQFGAPAPARAIAACLLDIVGKNNFGQSDFPWGLYHFQSDPGVTWYDFAQSIFKQASDQGLIKKEIKVKPITSEQFVTPVTRPKNSKLDGFAINKTLGIQSADWEVYLKEILTASL